MAKLAPAKSMPAWAWGVLACLVTLLVFLPALRFPFFPFWDDDIHVHANPHIAHLSFAGFVTFWSGPWQQLYIPLTYSVWIGLAALSRWWDGLPIVAGALNPAWFHGANVIVHTASAALVFVLLRRVATKLFPLTAPHRPALAAALGAAFFALHPLQVEPVAWISGLRDVLGGCLGLASLVVLLDEKRPGFPRWLGATILFAASLAAKPAGVTLPLVAAILAAVPFGWKPSRMLRELGPWLVLGVVWVLLTSHAQWAAEMARHLVPPWMRPLVAGDALAFYAAKVLWPVGLCADYGRAPNVAKDAGWLWWTWLFPTAGVVALASVKRLRLYLVPVGIFVSALLPTLGLVPFNFQIVSTVADRYMYFALLGPAMALSLFVVRPGRGALATVTASTLIAILAALTLIRLPLWSEDLKLFADTLRVNPTSWKAMHNYASALDDRGRTTEAVALMNQVTARRPDSAEAFNDLGIMLWKLGHREKAVQTMLQSVQLRATPESAKNLAIMEAELGNKAGHIEALRLAISLAPDNSSLALQLAWHLATTPDARLRNGSEALELAKKAIQQDGATPQAAAILIAAQAETGQFDVAAENARTLARELEAVGDPFVLIIRRDILAPTEAGRPIRTAP